MTNEELAAKLDGLEIAIGGTVTPATVAIIGEVSAALKAVAALPTKGNTLVPPPIVADAVEEPAPAPPVKKSLRPAPESSSR